ncbi:IS110 family transposase [Novipirellula artificiosorum]|uniref:Transposase n=1 Tax=Novipirellula artificiosorum TaxID=2528016 RepID=A0A5C6CW68_9BACT|nr:transposase [Novipirellula artificiosorum]TWU27954.1 Transposase [Novipirellula artificiosorum]
MKILALDLGKFNSVCCFFDTKTRKSRFLTTPTERQHIASVLKNAKVDLVVMESCGPSGWINDLAQSLGLSTLVCSTNEEAWRWANVKRKTDKDDALKLARLAAMRELKPVHLPSQEHREFRSLVKYRKMLDRRINKTKNTIRAWFVNHGITIDSGDKAWHTGREHINSFRKPIQECGADELWKGELDIELTILDSLTQQLDMIVKKLEAIGKTDPRIVRLMTIPGVGPRTAEILLALIKHVATMDNQYRPPDALTSTNESDHRGFSNHFYTQLFYQHNLLRRFGKPKHHSLRPTPRRRPTQV